MSLGGYETEQIKQLINTVTIRKMECQMKLLFGFLILVFCSSCGPAFGYIDGVWSASDAVVSIDIKGKQFTWEDKSNPEISFSAKIISIRKLPREKIELQLGNDRKVKIQVFNNETLFLYKESGYLRLKKS